jgi:hypothetical protein
MPRAIGLSKGTIISKGLAVVVIGGLTTSTLLTLVIVPIVYELIYGIKGRISRMFSKKAGKSSKAEAIAIPPAPPIVQPFGKLEKEI